MERAGPTEGIDCGTVAVFLRASDDAHSPWLDEEVAIDRCEVDISGLNRLLVLCVGDREVAGISQDLGEELRTGGVGVKNDTDRGAEISRQIGSEKTKRINAPG